MIEHGPRAVGPSIGAARVSRRRFLGASLATAAGVGLLPQGALGEGKNPARGSGTARTTRGGAARKARNVIFLIADGMSIGTLTIADMMHRRATGKPSNWCSMWMRPGVSRAMVQTHAADSLVTDSAAAGTAWSCGVSVNNGALNIGPDGREYVPLLVAARERGFRTGSVTSTSLTCATPASFMSVAADRGDDPRIARQIASGRFDVLMGGGAEHFSPGVLEGPNLKLVRNARELRESGIGDKDDRLLGIFSRGHTPYELDRPASVPDLATMTWEALNRLHARVRDDAGDRDDAGFVLQVEGGRVDHAAHANDACGLMHDMLAFDRALGVALDYAQRHGDTLVIATTDHANANPGITLYGPAGLRGLERIEKARHSFSWIFGQIRERTGEPALTLARIVREAIGVELDKDEAQWAAGAIFDREQRDGFEARRSGSSVLASVLANHLAVSFVSRNHTNDMVEATAIGPGAEALAPVVHITELHHLVTGALAIA